MRTALVLGGGGLSGSAWQAGVLQGLLDNGVDLRKADLILGTSGGAPLGARLAIGMTPEKAGATFVRLDAVAPVKTKIDIDLGEMNDAYNQTSDRYIRIGMKAMAAKTMSLADHMATMGRAISEYVGWPANFACVAMDVFSGAIEVWDARSGVELAPAVASSCAVPYLRPPVPVGGSIYMDGGVRSGTNADLAFGCNEVIIVTPVRHQKVGAEHQRELQMREIASLRMVGAHPTLITADLQALDVIGPETMVAGACAGAYSEGLRQGRALRLRHAA